MALITKNSIYKIEKSRNYIHKPVKTTYTSFQTDKGKYFQFDTYGSEDRIMHTKISQSIQFDKEMAQAIILVLQQEFNL